MNDLGNCQDFGDIQNIFETLKTFKTENNSRFVEIFEFRASNRIHSDSNLLSSVEYTEYLG